MVEMLISLGYDVNQTEMNGNNTQLVSAINHGHLEMARYLLSIGANPNLGRTLFAAVNLTSDALALEFVKLLASKGVEVNRVFLWFEDENRPFTALSFALTQGKQQIAEYLQSIGGATPEVIQKKKKPVPSSDDYVTEYMVGNFGPVRDQSLVEVLPTGMPITIRVIPPNDKCPHQTLFTVGLSNRAMNVPAGSEAYSLAELFLQLPAAWPMDRLDDLQYSWPVQWLRIMAKYPTEHNTWLGGPFTIISNDDPPRAIAPNVGFSSFLLLAEKELINEKGDTVQLYRVVPLFDEERALELRAGVDTLMRAFDQFGVPFVIDPNRLNVGKS